MIRRPILTVILSAYELLTSRWRLEDDDDQTSHYGHDQFAQLLQSCVLARWSAFWKNLVSIRGSTLNKILAQAVSRSVISRAIGSDA